MTASQWPHAMVLAPLIVAATLGSSGWLKRSEGRNVLSAITLLRAPMFVRKLWLARSVPWVEMVIAALLLFAPAPVFGIAALAALVLSLIYWLLIARALTWDRPPSCGCFGRIGEANISWRTLFRNSLLVIASALTLAAATTGFSVVDTVRRFDAGDVAWLVGALAAVAMTWAVLARTRQPERQEVWVDIDPDYDTRGDDEYVRRPIPKVDLLFDGMTRPLSALAAERARLIVHLSADPTSGRIIKELDNLGIPPEVLGVHPLVDIPVGPAFASQHPEWVEKIILAKPGQRLAMGLNTVPSAVVYGTDGLTAGGPENGLEDVKELLAELREALAGAEVESSSSAQDQSAGPAD